MPETMTPRERVVATLNHKEPDRVPITLGGSANHLTEERYVLLRDHLGYKISRAEPWWVFTPHPITTRYWTSLARTSVSSISARQKTISPIR